MNTERGGGPGHLEDTGAAGDGDGSRRTGAAGAAGDGSAGGRAGRRRSRAAVVCVAAAVPLAGGGALLAAGGVPDGRTEPDGRTDPVASGGTPAPLALDGWAAALPRRSRWTAGRRHSRAARAGRLGGGAGHRR
ncbi:hypothetical protein QQY24_22560 [Streptomyces sp. TG1A-8]|uniref:hypothetical protein n=1 Tax=Streptomyces sp. TG1A-8 TaxID=3051385 RepID=UPI00265BF8DD|nr:hypothetical protein [Streptomyces sp. TG1A-8]MDO0928055.1 hypothetical protein [Streptomyces sp. TG1A-8]